MPRMSEPGDRTVGFRAVLVILSLGSLVAALFLVGCGKATSTMTVSKSPTGGDETVEAPEAARGAEEATVGAASGEAPQSETEDSDGELVFTDAPEARGGGRSGADGVLAVRFGEHEGYERVVIDLGTGDQAAWRVPEWTLSSPTGDSLLRVNFPSVDITHVSDGDFEGATLNDFHVVRAPEGGVFVDVLSTEAFTYRVLELRKPARLVVDFKPSPDASLGVPAPVSGGDTVVTEPRSWKVVTGALTVSGYSRNFEATNDITLTDSEGRVIAQETVRSNDWSQTWGYFETTLDVPEFSGTGTLKVGASSARDGAFEGLGIPLRGD